MSQQSVMIIGASVAGVSAARALGDCGFNGPITMIGAESHAPYDRPPLSKQALVDPAQLSQVQLPGLDFLPSITWRLGVAARSLDLRSRKVSLTSGDQLGFDILIIATGARARMLPETPALAGIYRLRTRDDAAAIAAAIASSPRQVVVVGGGFIGTEVAASLSMRGIQVAVVESTPSLLSRQLGRDVGDAVTRIHRAHGVDIRCSTSVVEYRGGPGVEAVRLSDGTVLRTDCVIQAVGAAPSSDWVQGSGIKVDDGVRCDERCQAAPGVFVAGDVARWRSIREKGPVRVEHWDNAVRQGDYVGRVCVLPEPELAATPAYDPVPWFWSDQYEHKLQLVGSPLGHDQLVWIEPPNSDGRWAAAYGREGSLRAVVAMDWPKVILRARPLIDSGSDLAAAAHQLGQL